MARTAIFGAGCFWGVEAAFRRLDGVLATRSATPAATSTTRATSRSVTAAPVTPRSSRSPTTPRRCRTSAARDVLGRARSDPGQPAGAGRRRAVPLRDLRRRRRAARRRGGLARRTCRRGSPAGRDVDRGRAAVLGGRGLPPAVPREARPRELHALAWRPPEPAIVARLLTVASAGRAIDDAVRAMRGREPGCERASRTATPSTPAGFAWPGGGFACVLHSRRVYWRRPLAGTSAGRVAVTADRIRRGTCPRRSTGRSRSRSACPSPSPSRAPQSVHAQAARA